MTAASRRGIPFIVGMVLAVPLACGTIREDEFQCENAVAHLKACCPGLDAMGVACNYATGCGVTVYPVLDVEQSKCIEGESCDTIRTTGICDAVTALSYLPGSDAAGSGPTVCPMALQAAPPPSDNAVDSGITIACAAAIDCPVGQVCCVGLVGTVPGTSCLAPPCPPLASGLLPMGAQLCATSAECPAEETCLPPPAGLAAGVMLCGSTSVGPTDAAGDVRDGDKPPTDATFPEGSESAAGSGDPMPEASAADSTPDGGSDAPGDEQ